MEGAEEKDLSQPQDAQGQTDAETDAQAGTAKPGGLPTEIQEQVNQIIERRLSRERKKWQPYEEWKPVIDFFSKNQDAAQKLQELIDSHEPSEAHLAMASVEQKVEAKLAAVQALLDLRTSDVVFRQHENEIREYAEDLGLDLERPEHLKIAYKAWRGEPAVQDKLRKLAEAEQKLQDAQRRKAGLLPGRGPVPAPKKKAAEMTDEELLAQHGYAMEDLIVSE